MNVAGVLLAAGGSTRFGQPKQLLEWNGVPMVAHVADGALEAGLSPVVAVLGHAAQEVQKALAGRPVRIATNWRWEEGLSTSIQAGLSVLPPETDAAVFLQCDQPLVTPDLLRRLVARFEETGAPIVCPAVQGQCTPPALFARSLFRELAGLTGDQGGRVLLLRYLDQVETVEVEDPDLLADLDTPEEYERLRKRYTPPSAAAVLASIHYLIVDMDGVLWRGDQPMPGLADFFATLRALGVRFVLATNNASKRPEEYREKLARFGVEVPLEAILTSAQATAEYLASFVPPGTPIYAIGGTGVRYALEEKGFVLTERDARYVVVGWDPDLHWQKMARAALLIQRGAGFIGTNPDITYPTPEGVVPGNGSNLAVLELTTGVKPVVIGKPEPGLFQAAIARMGATPEATAVLGDRLDTDILGGRRAGLRTILVLSGITSPEALARSPVRPDLVCASIRELAHLWVREVDRVDGDRQDLQDLQDLHDL
ncbi:MAG: HAD-IIA family hydrolase [Anaerolineae bacterium]|nr:HAD-IIA family hydrolase [Anaerolineae bacterium]MDW8068475.1 HAD-IIA family hydrolase [Anaerolineae bacterium]